MTTTSTYESIAEEVLRGVGGKGNVRSLAHCATRLRFVLVDPSRADKAAVESTSGVITVVEAGGQFQVVIGNTVGHVYDAVVAQGVDGTGGGSTGGPLSRVIDLVTSIFIPFLWTLAAAGLLKALLTVAVKISPGFGATSTYAIWFAAADAVFQFLPILLAVTAAKRFKANQFTAIVIACALVYSATIAVMPGAHGASVTLQAFAQGGGKLTFLGIPVVMANYLSAVVPTILAVYVQSHVERLAERVLPAMVRNFGTPLVTLALVVPASFLAIGPVSTWIGDTLASGVDQLWGLSPWAAGTLLGGLWQVLVVFGLHWAFIPIAFQQLATTGHTDLAGALFAPVLAQAAATFAVFLRTRDRDLKAVAGPAALSGFLAGVTEPAVYGVTLRLKRPFVFACVGGAVGGGIATAGGSAATSFVLPGAITVTSTLNVGSFALQLLGCGIGMVIAFALTLVVGFKDLPAASGSPSDAASHGKASQGGTASQDGIATLVAPVAGKVVPLAEVADQVFASGAMGSGLAVIPSEGKVYAPLSGTLVSVMPHAFGIRSDSGVEVLVHIGLNTVELQGRGFTPAVAQGQRVNAGDPLTDVDLQVITDAGYDPITVLIVTDPGAHTAVVPTATGDVQPRRAALDLVG
ncbi:beta-glucoside-specific PTS transporter subunit IIABC [Streptomyces sp. Go-475]|uniref:beta-glucoside-specific PTS transporter subunit IIABC n=1 Tax=Streptomyces sp. Go-475 TaxID=2072505 RepID=UPI000DEFC370|nr:beta-glucoside-specific PTS transporter subunit IIABC [Streptomyces sp. Go-475]AXE86598.1 PTS system beta-glucoside-specific EIIBCA component [Streptomyces sp. Go-475]